MERRAGHSLLLTWWWFARALVLCIGTAHILRSQIFLSKLLVFNDLKVFSPSYTRPKYTQMRGRDSINEGRSEGLRWATHESKWRRAEATDDASNPRLSASARCRPRRRVIELPRTRRQFVLCSVALPCLRRTVAPSEHVLHARRIPASGMPCRPIPRIDRPAITKTPWIAVSQMSFWKWGSKSLITSTHLSLFCLSQML